MKIKYLLIGAICAATTACGGDENNAKTNDQVDTAEELAEEPTGKISDMADFKFHTMIANLPSPLETFHVISGVDISLSQASLTNTQLAGQLSTISSKAYGYGVYITDMGCMAYQNQNQQTLDYYQVCRNLAGELGAGDVFDKSISANFEENTGDKEQFVRMMNNAFDAMDQYMVDNERFVNATEIFVGSWVESQIIATRILKDKALDETNRPVYEGIYAQKRHASDLMNVLGEIDTEINREVLTAVEDLMMFYAGFSTVENITQEDLVELEQKLETLKAKLLA